MLSTLFWIAGVISMGLALAHLLYERPVRALYCALAGVAFFFLTAIF